MMLYFNSMNIPSSYDCENNFLEIDDGSSRGSPYISGKNSNTSKIRNPIANPHLCSQWIQRIGTIYELIL